ncbi:MAG: hypothetical protein WC412_07070 [Candidatus Omnitrophota bacterium]|jgi:hypothetical protein
MSEESFVKKLEELGYQKVLENLFASKYNPFEKPIVSAWLKGKELETAMDANKIAKSAKNASWWAILISIFSILASIFTVFFK